MDETALLVDRLVDLIIADDFDCYECDGGRELVKELLAMVRPNHVVLGQLYRCTAITRGQHEARGRAKAWREMQRVKELQRRLEMADANSPAKAYLEQCDALGISHPKGCDCPKH